MENSKPKAWYEHNPQRLRQDIDDMLWHFPIFHYTITNDTVTWQGSVKILAPDSKLKEYPLRIECRNDYPSEAPRVYCEEGFPTNGRWRPPHLFKDGALCLFYPSDKSHRRWTKDDKLSTIVAWACEWLHAYEYWRRTKRWLGKEAPHPRRKRKR